MGAGMGNTTASFNTYLGFNAGFSNQTGAGNTFVGWRAGFNTTGTSNTFFGESVGSNTTTATNNAFFAGGFANTTGGSNAFFGFQSGGQNTTGSFNTFLGSQAGSLNTTGSSNVFIGQSAGNPLNTQVNNSVAIGASASVNTSNTIVLGTTAETTRIPGLLNVSDTGTGNFRLRVVNTAAGGGVVTPNLYLPSFPQGPSGNPLCWKAAGDGIAANIITNCISAFTSEKVKTDIQPFSGGLNVIKRLVPIAFKWKVDGASDIGLNAEDVAAVDPSLVTRNGAGEAEGVKEHRLNVVLINAIKEQQLQLETQKALIEAQQESIRKLHTQTDALTSLICQSDPKAVVCRPSAK
jgi:hypothetical protein